MLFSVKKEKINLLRFIPTIVLIIFLSGFVLFANSTTSINTSRGKTILERAISRSITQCYALEGMYPPSLDYLIDNYGLTYDTNHYFIDYNYIGSNLRPDVTIIEKD